MAGLDVSSNGREVRDVLGVVTQQDGLDTDLSPRDNLIVYGILSGLAYSTLREKRTRCCSSSI